MHYLYDVIGGVVEFVPFCSDACLRDYCAERGIEYDGWNGCHDGGDYRHYCAQCGTYAGGGTGEESPCDCMLHNVVVNRFLSDTGEQCEHGNYIQLPAQFVR